MAQEIRVRFAPSPTGFFHLGNARTALFNYLFAKKMDGKFILRIEDTDTERSKEEFELDMEHCLAWLELGWDEGPETKDLFGPYRQSERKEIYQKYIDQLIKEKKAYYCYCTQEELEKERKEQEDHKIAPKYSGKCRNISEDEIAKYKAEGRKPAIRFKINSENNQKIKFKDLIRGEVEFDPALISDFVIVKADGSPIFLLTNIIDDAEMRISHVIRGEDHLSNTPKQILLAEAMNLKYPEYAHLPMILNPDRSKLSKRKNPTSVSKDYQDKGYLPEAMINFLALLGWSPTKSNKLLPDEKKQNSSKEEILSIKELIEEFNLESVGKSPAIFDQQKLDYLNGYYIRKMPTGDLAKRCLPFLIDANLIENKKNTCAVNEKYLEIIGLVQERMKKISEVPALTDFFFKEPKYDSTLLIPKGKGRQDTKKALEESLSILEKENDFTRDSIEQLLRALAKKIGISAGEILWPIRVALSGNEASPGVFELIEFFGKDETVKRIKFAIDMLQ